MPKVKYVGTSNFREIKKADWTSVEVEDQGAVMWARDRLNARTGAKLVHDISDVAWTFLQESEKNDFELVEESPADSTDTTETVDTVDTEDKAATSVTSPTSARRVRDTPQA